MARYGTQVQQTLVDMYNPLNIKFYSDILDKAQSNLNQGAAAQAKFMEDVYGEKYANQEAHDLAVKQAEQGISGLLDAPFVSPANVIKGISKAAQNYAPYKNLNARQMELIKQAEAFKLQHGANALITDPSKAELVDASGNWISPEQLSLDAINKEDIDKRFITSQKNVLTQPYNPEGKWTKSKSLPGYYERPTGTGLSPSEVPEYYGQDGKLTNQVAEQMLAEFPQLIKIKGSKEAALDYIKNSNLQTAGAYGNTRDVEVKEDWYAKLAAEESMRKRLDKTGQEKPIIPQGTPYAIPNSNVTKDYTGLEDYVNGKLGAVATPGVAPVENFISNVIGKENFDTIEKAQNWLDNTLIGSLLPGASERKRMLESPVKAKAAFNEVKKEYSQVYSQIKKHAYDKVGEEGFDVSTKEGRTAAEEKATSIADKLFVGYLKNEEEGITLQANTVSRFTPRELDTKSIINDMFRRINEKDGVELDILDEGFKPSGEKTTSKDTELKNISPDIDVDYVNGRLILNDTKTGYNIESSKSKLPANVAPVLDFSKEVYSKFLRSNDESFKAMDGPLTVIPNTRIVATPTYFKGADGNPYVKFSITQNGKKEAFTDRGQEYIIPFSHAEHKNLINSMLYLAYPKAD